MSFPFLSVPVSCQYCDRPFPPRWDRGQAGLEPCPVCGLRMRFCRGVDARHTASRFGCGCEETILLLKVLVDYMNQAVSMSGQGRCRLASIEALFDWERGGPTFLNTAALQGFTGARGGCAAILQFMRGRKRVDPGLSSFRSCACRAPCAAARTSPGLNRRLAQLSALGATLAPASLLTAPQPPAAVVPPPPQPHRHSQPSRMAHTTSHAPYEVSLERGEPYGEAYSLDHETGKKRRIRLPLSRPGHG